MSLTALNLKSQTSPSSHEIHITINHPYAIASTSQHQRHSSKKEEIQIPHNQQSSNHNNNSETWSAIPSRLINRKTSASRGQVSFRSRTRKKFKCQCAYFPPHSFIITTRSFVEEKKDRETKGKQKGKKEKGKVSTTSVLYGDSQNAQVAWFCGLAERIK
jgi:hypothetical protein